MNWINLGMGFFIGAIIGGLVAGVLLAAAVEPVEIDYDILVEGDQNIMANQGLIFQTLLTLQEQRICGSQAQLIPDSNRLISSPTGSFIIYECALPATRGG